MPAFNCEMQPDPMATNNAAMFEPGKWIGEEISAARVALIMGVALQMSLVSMLQPLFLKAMVVDGRLATEQVGTVAALELALTGLVVAVAMARFQPGNLPRIMASASGLYCLANIAAAFAATPLIIMVARMICGGCSGLFLWLLTGMIGRSTLPARMNGIFLAFQGTVGLVISALLANLIIPRFGSTGCFLLLAALGLLGAIGSAWLPSSYARISSQRAVGLILPTGRGLIALATIAALLAGLVSAWIFLPLLSLQFGYPRSVTSLGLPLSIAMQIVGGLLSAALAVHLSYRVVMPSILLLFMAMLAVLLSSPGPLPAIASYGMFGFMWIFIGAFGYAYTLATDPSRSSLMFMGPAQLLGAGTGSIIASVGVKGDDVRGGIVISIALLGLALILFLVASQPRLASAWRS